MSASACILLVVDESSAMETPVVKPVGASSLANLGERPKSKAESVATVVNALFKRLSAQADCDVSIVGYRTNGDGVADVGCRWAGPLAGVEWAAATQLATAPLAIEQRVRRTPSPNGIGQIEEPVSFPIWYRPEIGGKAAQVAAFEYCRGLLERWATTAPASAGAPLVMHITSGASGDGNPQQIIESVQQIETPGGKPIVMHIHVSSSDTVPTVLYPSNRAYVPAGTARDLYDRASVLPDRLANWLRTQHKVSVHTGARGAVFNAKMVEVSQFLSLVHAHLADAGSALAQPPAAATAAMPAPTVPAALQPSSVATSEEEPSSSVSEASVATPTCPAAGALSPEQPTVLLFVLDRSVENAGVADPQNTCSKLVEQLQDACESVVKNGGGAVDVGVISYGADALGQTEVRTTLEGGLAGRFFARDNELEAGAIRVDETVEEISNGVGGIISIPRRKPLLVEIEPSPFAPASEALVEAARLISLWLADHPGPAMPPVVVHLTRGRHEFADLDAGLRRLREASSAAGPPLLYHLVITESDHPPVSYPASESDLNDESLRVLWRVTSPLLCAEQLAAEKPNFSPAARGIVVNAKFNLLVDAFKRGLGW